MIPSEMEWANALLSSARHISQSISHEHAEAAAM